MPRLDWKVLVVLLALIWGLNFLEIRVAVLVFPPLLVTLGRLVLASTTVLAVLVASRQKLPRNLRTWAHIAVAALLCNSAPYALFAWGETEVSSVLAGILNAITPLMTVIAAAAFLPEERPGRSRLLGFAIGLAGVAIVVDPFGGVAAPSLKGALALLAATACYGLGYVYVRRNLAQGIEGAVSLAGAQMLAATVEVAFLTPFVAGMPNHVPAAALIALVVLGVAGTGVGYILQYAIVRATGATTSSLVLYLTPIVSTAAGVVLLGERLAWSQPAGAVVILAGVALAQGRVPAFLTRSHRTLTGEATEIGAVAVAGDEV